jgi:hypothetical protein
MWISDFGMWISDFGMWISDFGMWISDFGMMRYVSPHSEIRNPKSTIRNQIIFLLKPLIMRTLHVLLFFILSIFWQPSEALATVQTVQPTTATTQQMIPATPQKQTRFEKRVQKFAKSHAAGRGFNGDASQWLWYAVGFFVVALILGVLKVLSSLSGLFWAIAVICLAIWALKFFGIL